jgi:Gas vesicle protein K
VNDKVLAAPASSLPEVTDALSRRINADPESVEQGLAQLVLTIVDLLREIMERQALRRIDGGGLDDEQIERLGRTFMLLQERMDELVEEFGLTREDLNLNLGPLGNLM